MMEFPAKPTISRCLPHLQELHHLDMIPPLGVYAKSSTRKLDQSADEASVRFEWSAGYQSFQRRLESLAPSAPSSWLLRLRVCEVMRAVA